MVTVVYCYTIMSLGEKIKVLSGNRRKFFLLRVADMDTKTALKLCGVVRGTYNTWCQNTDFVELYRQRADFANDFKQEAVQLLRRENQLEAVLLEGKILSRMKADLNEPYLPEGSIVRTNLAREAYSKLMSELDAPPPATVLTWEQRIQRIFNPSPEQIEIQGEVIDGQFSETANIEETKYQTCEPPSVNQ